MNIDEVESPLRVLCVDDNRDSADSLALLLRLMGIAAQVCYDGFTALKLNDSFRPSVCFIDFNMPAMNGGELANRLRAGTGWQPILLVALTAMNSGQIYQAPSSFDMYFRKPVDPAQIIQVVASLVRPRSQ